MKVRAFIRRLVVKTFSPVCQDPTAVIMGEHGGGIVRMRPVIDADGVITMWVADPHEAELMAQACSAPQQVPQMQTLPPQFTPPPLPGDTAAPSGFNPAGVGGL